MSSGGDMARPLLAGTPILFLRLGECSIGAVSFPHGGQGPVKSLEQGTDKLAGLIINHAAKLKLLRFFVRGFASRIALKNSETPGFKGFLFRRRLEDRVVTGYFSSVFFSSPPEFRP